MDYLDILRLIAEKDKAGLEALYKAYGNKLYSYAVKRWQLSEDAAWDVVYQTLDTLVLKLSAYSFESKAHFENFLFKVFTNYLRQHFRRHRKHQFDEVSLTIEHDSATDTGEEEWTDQPVGYEMDEKSLRDYYQSEKLDNPKLFELENALNTLDENDKAILLLRAQNYSYEEIASMLHIENKDLKVKHHRLKTKIQQLLSQKTSTHA